MSVDKIQHLSFLILVTALSAVLNSPNFFNICSCDAALNGFSCFRDFPYPDFVFGENHFTAFYFFPLVILTDLGCIFFRKMLAANEAYFVNVERRQGRILCRGDIKVCGVP